MKLYKLLQDIILEESTKILLTEGVSEDEVRSAIANKINVNILYDDYPNANPSVPPSKRYIQVYNLGLTKTKDGEGNLAIRAYQIFGGSKTTPREGAWKIFRLDRIRSWQPTKVKFATAISNKDSRIPTYNTSGDMSMSQVKDKVEFNKIGQKPINNPNVEKLSPDEVIDQRIKNKDKRITKNKSSYIVNNPVDTSKTTQSIDPDNINKDNDTDSTTSRPK
jgi:hypothetical protein